MEKLQNDYDFKNQTGVTSSIENNRVENKIESVIDENDKNILRNLLLNKKVDEEDKNIDNKLNEDNLTKSKENENVIVCNKNLMKDVENVDASIQNNNLELVQEKYGHSLSTDLDFNSEELEKNLDDSSINLTQITKNQFSLVENMNNNLNEEKHKLSEFCQKTLQPESLSNNSCVKNDEENKLIQEPTNSENIILNRSNIDLEENNDNNKLQTCDVQQINEEDKKTDFDGKNLSYTELNEENDFPKSSLKYCDNSKANTSKLSLSSNDIEIEKTPSKEINCSLNLEPSNVIIEKNNLKGQPIENRKNNNLDLESTNIETKNNQSFEQIIQDSKKATTLNDCLHSDLTSSKNSSLLSTSLSDISKNSFTDLTKTRIEEGENIYSDKNFSNLSNESLDDTKQCKLSKSSKIPSESSPIKSPVKNYYISPTIPKFNQQNESSCDSNSSSNLIIDQEWDQKNPLKRKLSPPKTNGENSPNAKHFHFDSLEKNKQINMKSVEILNNVNLIPANNQDKSEKILALNNVNSQQIINNLCNEVSNSSLATTESNKMIIKSHLNQLVKNNKDHDTRKLKITHNQSGKLETNNKKTPRKRKKTKSENLINNLAIDLTQSQNLLQQEISYHAGNSELEAQKSDEALQRSLYSLSNCQIRQNYPVQFMSSQQKKLSYQNLHRTELQLNKANSEYHNSIIQSHQLLQLPNKIFESPQKHKPISNIVEPTTQYQPLLNYQLFGQQFIPSNSNQSFQNDPLYENRLQTLQQPHLPPLSSDKYYQITPDSTPQLQISSQSQKIHPNSIEEQPHPMAYSKSCYDQSIYQYQMGNELPMNLIEKSQSNFVQYKCFRCLSACFPTIQNLQEHQKYCLFHDKILQSTQNSQIQYTYAITPSDNIQLNGNNSGSNNLTEIGNQHLFQNRKKSLEEQKRKFFLCSACGTYHQDWNLFLHMCKIHRKYICLYCMGLFPNGQQLTKHLELKHNLEKNCFNSQFELLKSCKGSSYFLMCTNCEYIFSENDDFYEHICAEFKQPCLQCEQKVLGNKDCRCKYNAVNNNNVTTKKTKKNKNRIGILNQKYLKSNTETFAKNNIPVYNNNMEQIDSDEGGNYLEHFNYNDNDLINLYKSNRNLLKQKEEQKLLQESLSHKKLVFTDQLSESTSKVVQIKADEEINDTLVVPKIKLIIPKKYQNNKAIESEQSSTESEICDEEIRLMKLNIDEENINTDEMPKQNLNFESKNDSDMDIDVTCSSREEFVSKTQLNSSVEIIGKEFPISELNKNNIGSVDPKMQYEVVENDTELTTAIDRKSPGQNKENLKLVSIEDANYKPETSERAVEIIQNVDVGEKSMENEKPKAAEGIELADDDCAVQELALEAPLDKIPMIQFLRVCLQATYPTCLYCYHARRIAVNGNSLALHMLAEHRFSATVDSITAEELQPQTIILKLKSFLPELNDYYFNMETYCNVVQNERIKLANAVDETQFECFQCRFVTKIHKELYVHNRKMHLRTAILCYMCRSNFYSYSEILCHICPGAPNKQIIFDIKFRCCLCELDNISSAFRLMVHLRKKHLACDVCLEYCYDQSRLSNHVWKHKLHHLCYRCGIAYRNKPDITKHLFWKHGTESVLCRRCLQKRWPHVYHFCIPPSTFVCEICQLTFSRAMYLNVHKRLHSGEEPYPCTEDNCDKKFISRKLLLKHVDEHYASPVLKLIQEHKEVPNLDLNIENVEDLTDKDKDSKKEICSNEKEKQEPKKKNECSSKKKRKKSKREQKELLEDLNLQAPNLSESGSSDTDSDNGSISKKVIKEPVIQIENELVPSVMLSPASEFGEDDESESKNENVDKTLEIWKNFENFQATQRSQSVTAENIDKPELKAHLPMLRAVQSDHDYCLTFKSTEEKTANDNKTSENNKGSKSNELSEFIKFDINLSTELSAKSKKEKSPRKQRESGNDTDSSSSNSSSDSDSSCSCGSNCSCSSGSSSSSSPSSSSSESDDSASSSQGKKKSILKREAREERKNKKKEEETIKNSSTEIVDVVTADVLPVKLELVILEADLATEESDTDEDFYDDHPQKIANDILTEKRKQLMQQMSPHQIQNNYDIVENSRPSTPSLPGEEMAKERRSKGKKKKRKNSSKGIMPLVKLNGSEIIDCQQIVDDAEKFASIRPNQVNISMNNEVSEKQLLPPPLPIADMNHSIMSNISFPSQPGQIYHNRLSTESSSDAGVVGSTTNSLKRSKRARRPNRFYGYSSDDDQHHSIPNLYSGALKPTPPPQFKWSKEDLPSPSKSILSHKNHKTNLGVKKGGVSRITKKKENSMNKLKIKFSKSIGQAKLPPIPTLKIRPSDIFPQIPPSPLDYQPPRPRPQPEKPQPPQYDLKKGPIVQTVVNLLSDPVGRIEIVSNKLFDTSGTGEENDDDSTSSDDDKLTIPVAHSKSPKENSSNKQNVSLESLQTIIPQPKEQEPKRIPPALLPNPDFSIIQYFKRNNIRFPIRPPAGARAPREGESVYCYCRCPYDEVSEMIACDGNECMIEWFHFECVGILVAPQGKWYCAECKPNATVPGPPTTAAASASLKFEYFNR